MSVSSHLRCLPCARMWHQVQKCAHSRVSPLEFRQGLKVVPVGSKGSPWEKQRCMCSGIKSTVCLNPTLAHPSQAADHLKPSGLAYETGSRGSQPRWKERRHARHWATYTAGPRPPSSPCTELSDPRRVPLPSPEDSPLFLSLKMTCTWSTPVQCQPFV